MDELSTTKAIETFDYERELSMFSKNGFVPGEIRRFSGCYIDDFYGVTSAGSVFEHLNDDVVTMLILSVNRGDMLSEEQLQGFAKHTFFTGVFLHRKRARAARRMRELSFGEIVFMRVFDAKYCITTSKKAA